MTRHPATCGRPSRLQLATALTAAGAILGVALLWPGGSDPISLDLAEVTRVDGEPLYVGRTEITVAEWSACHADGGCTLDLQAPGEGKDSPATGISSVDANEHITWINARSGPQYRLPTKAEWSALADEVLPELRWASAHLVETPGVDPVLHPTGDFSTTSTGLLDLDGNVWEWRQ